MADGGQGRSTVEAVRAHPAGGGVVVRRVLLGLLLVVVLVGASGYLGVRTDDVRASGNGYTLHLVYAQVARSGLDVPWEVTVTAPGGFTADELTLAVSADYFDLFETQAFHPEPDAATRDDEFIYFTFVAPPAGTVFRVVYDAYIQPASQFGRSADLQLLVEDELQVALTYRTWLVP